MRRVITPQRDLVDSLASLPGPQLSDRDRLHNIHDRLIRIGDLLDSCRELTSGATDLYLSRTSNRQNEAVKQLTVIATIFLPLGFITGFFGLDFSYLGTHAFNGRWLIAVGTTLATVVGLLVYFRRKGWVAG